MKEREVGRHGIEDWSTHQPHHNLKIASSNPVPTRPNHFKCILKPMVPDKLLLTKKYTAKNSNILSSLSYLHSTKPINYFVRTINILKSMNFVSLMGIKIMILELVTEHKHQLHHTIILYSATSSIPMARWPTFILRSIYLKTDHSSYFKTLKNLTIDFLWPHNLHHITCQKDYSKQ